MSDLPSQLTSPRASETPRVSPVIRTGVMPFLRIVSEPPVTTAMSGPPPSKSATSIATTWKRV